jgi:hypothetical protein
MLHKYVSTAMIAAVWLSGASYGFAVMWRYAGTPSSQAAAPSSWPAGAPIQQARGRWTLLMFNHPQCPCSRAGIGELSEMLTRLKKDVDTRIFFYLPSAESADWVETDLWRSAAAIPGVQTLVDRGGKVAKQFGAATSGQVLLYNEAGMLLFKGGITAGRGHWGDSPGQRAILSLVGGSASNFTTAPVFGCSLKEL